MKASTILVVDDDAFARTLVRDAIAPLGPHRIVEAADGVEAVAAVDAERPAVVFLDLLMPRKSGMEALPEIRRRSPATQIVVVSSMESEALVAEAMRAGAIGFIGKPFHPDEIAAALRKALDAGTDPSRDV